MKVCFSVYNVLCTNPVRVLTECCKNCRCKPCSFGIVLIYKYIKRYIIYRIVHFFVQHICQSSNVLPCVLLENHHIHLEGPVIWNVKMVEQVGGGICGLGIESLQSKISPTWAPWKRPFTNRFFPGTSFICRGFGIISSRGMWAKIIDTRFWAFYHFRQNV